MSYSRAFRFLGYGAILSSCVYIGPFLPSPSLWPLAILKLLPEFPNKQGPFEELQLGSGDTTIQQSPKAGSRLSECSFAKLSVIVPVYNEGSDRLRKVLESLADSTQHKLMTEIVVVDAGCTDDTLDALKTVNIKVPIKRTTSSSGRGQALIQGIQVSDGELILFLHTDTVVPKHYDAMLREKLCFDNKVLLTAFQFGFNLEDDKRSQSSRIARRLKSVERLTNIRSKFLWLPYGDQAIGMRRATLEQLGGIKEYKLMEDFDLVSRVRSEALQSGRLIQILPATALTSPRRQHTNGLMYNAWLNWAFVAGFVWGGIPPDRLFEYYYK